MTATPLAQLIDSVKTTNGWSDPDLVRNADKRGHTLTKSNISRYRNENPLISIKGSVIEALAAGLRVSVSHVAVAAVQSMGISLPSYDMPTVEQAIRLDASLSDRDRQVMMATLSGIRSVTETSHDTDTQPASDADRPPASGTPRETREGEKNNVRDLRPDDSSRRTRRGRDFTADPIVEMPGAAYDGDDAPTDYDLNSGPPADAPDPEGPEGGA